MPQPPQLPLPRKEDTASCMKLNTGVPAIFASITSAHQLPSLLVAVFPLGLGQLPKFDFRTLQWRVNHEATCQRNKEDILVQDYHDFSSEQEGRDFFNSLDQAGKGYLTQEDLKQAMRANHLPVSYARSLTKRIKRFHWFPDNITWDEFKAMLEAREPEISKAFGNLELSQQGTVQVGEVQELLHRMGLPGTCDDAAAVIRAVGSNEREGVPYNDLRNFMFLLPPEKFKAPLSPSQAWHQAVATSTGYSHKAGVDGEHCNEAARPCAGSVHGREYNWELDAQGGNGRTAGLWRSWQHGASSTSTSSSNAQHTNQALQDQQCQEPLVPGFQQLQLQHTPHTRSPHLSLSCQKQQQGEQQKAQQQQQQGEQGYLQAVIFGAIAGGLGACSSTLLLHPIDTLKTRLQSIPGARLVDVGKWWGAIGIRGMYQGIVPAASGAMVGHGLRTGGYEAALKLIQGLGITGLELQAQGMASGIGTVVGTVARIPCEVLKQRLQAGLYPSAPAALRATLKADGVPGLFRGTAVTLSREVPFYMFGMMMFQQLKAIANGQAFGKEPKQLPRSGVVALGVLAGCMSAVLTTPADVVKTRIMTAPVGQKMTAAALVAHIVRKEGFGALFKGAVARMFWTMPVGAINFAGYELAKQALITPSPSTSPAPSIDQEAVPLVVHVEEAQESSGTEHVAGDYQLHRL